MTKRRAKGKFLSTRVVVLFFAVLISGVSMYVTLDKVDSLDFELSQLQLLKAENTRSLQESWDLSGILNDRVDAAQLMALIDKDSPITKKYMAFNLEKYSLDKKTVEPSIEALKSVSREYEVLLLNKIDDYYTENFALNNRIESLQKDKNYYKSFAQLFQVMALVMALAFGGARV